MRGLYQQVRQNANIDGVDISPIGILQPPQELPFSAGFRLIVRLTAVTKIACYDDNGNQVAVAAYSWVSVDELTGINHEGLFSLLSRMQGTDASGNPQPVTGYPNFFPAFELNNNPNVPTDKTPGDGTGKIVELRPALAGPWFLFTWNNDSQPFDFVTLTCVEEHTLEGDLTSNTSVSNSTPVALPGTSLTFTLSWPITVVCIGSIDWSGGNSGDIYYGQLVVDGAAQSGNIVYRSSGGAGGGSHSRPWVVSLGAGQHTLSLQILQSSGNGTATANATNSDLVIHADTLIQVQKDTVNIPAPSTSINQACTWNPNTCCGGSGSGSGSAAGSGSVPTPPVCYQPCPCTLCKGDIKSKGAPCTWVLSYPGSGGLPPWPTQSTPACTPLNSCIINEWNDPSNLFVLLYWTADCTWQDNKGLGITLTYANGNPFIYFTCAGTTVTFINVGGWSCCGTNIFIGNNDVCRTPTQIQIDPVPPCLGCPGGGSGSGSTGGGGGSGSQSGPIACQWCVQTPTSWRVAVANVTNHGCLSCAGYDYVFNATQIAACTWEQCFPPDPCIPGNTYCCRVAVFSGTITVTLLTQFPNNQRSVLATYSTSYPNKDCLETYTLTNQHNPPFSNCTWPATITVTGLA
jgi:hypothetical protein